MISCDDLLRFRIACDECGKSLMLPGVYVADSHTALRGDAAKQGWSTWGPKWGLYDRCPACTAEWTIGSGEDI